MLSRHCSSYQAQIGILNVFHLYKNIFYFKPFLEKCFYATSNHLLQCCKTFQTPQMRLNHVALRPQRIELSVVIPSFFKGILHEKWSTKAFVLHSEPYSSSTQRRIDFCASGFSHPFSTIPTAKVASSGGHRPNRRSSCSIFAIIWNAVHVLTMHQICESLANVLAVVVVIIIALTGCFSSAFLVFLGWGK